MDKFFFETAWHFLRDGCRLGDPGTKDQSRTKRRAKRSWLSMQSAVMGDGALNYFVRYSLHFVYHCHITARAIRTFLTIDE